MIGAPVKVEETTKFSVRLGKFSTDGCRPLLVGFRDVQAKESILDNAWKLSKEKEGSPWAAVSIVPDLTQLQRKEEESLRTEAKEMNNKLSAEEAKNCCWKVVGRRGERRIVRVTLGRDEGSRDRSHLQNGRKGTRSSNRDRM